MLKAIAVLICSMVASVCHAQISGFYAMQISRSPKTDNKVTYYVSRVVDLEKLDCSGISKGDPPGNAKSKSKLYEQCIQEWFINELKAKGKWSEIEALALPGGAQVVDAFEYGGPDCKTGNEPGCFMTKAKAIEERLNAIELYKKMAAVVVEVE